MRSDSHRANSYRIQTLGPAVVALGVFVSACGQISAPVGSDDLAAPLVLTGSIPSSTDVSYADIDKEDREIIARAIDAVVGGQDADATMTWSNKQSGNSGTIASLDAASLSSTGCLEFKTTANTIEGVRLYAGTACRDYAGTMAITVLSASET